MPDEIKLSAKDAAVIADLAAAVLQPLDVESMLDFVQMGNFVLPVLKTAFAEAGLDLKTQERSELPPLVPGSWNEGIPGI